MILTEGTAYYAIDRTKIVHDTLDGETIIINLDSGAYYSLNAGAGLVWEFLQDGLSTTDVINSYRRLVGLEDGQADNVLPFLHQLETEGVVIESDTAVHAKERNTPSAIKLDKFDKLEPPSLSIYRDMEEFLKVDPIHEVDLSGWPNAARETKD
jgi:hypothetical protein